MNIQIYVGVIFRLFVWVLFLQFQCGFVCRLVSSWRLRPKMLQRLLRVQLEPINEAEAWPKFTMMQYNNSIVFLLFSFKIFLVLNFMRFLSSCWWRVCSFINNLNQAKILFTFFATYLCLCNRNMGSILYGIPRKRFNFVRFFFFLPFLLYQRTEKDRFVMLVIWRKLK